MPRKKKGNLKGGLKVKFLGGGKKKFKNFPKKKNPKGKTFFWGAEENPGKTEKGKFYPQLFGGGKKRKKISKHL